MTSRDMAPIVRRSLGLACIAVSLAAPVARAGIQPEPFRTGLFGVTAGQAVRISVLHAGNAKGIIEPCFRVFDAAGTLLFETDGGPLPGGVGAFVEFQPIPDDGSPPSGVPSRGGRVLVRVEVTPVPDDGVPVPDDGVPVGRLRRTVIPTVEVFDTATGETVFTPPFAAVAGIEPQPFAKVAGIEPVPFRTGLFGVTAGRAVRISVLNTGNAKGVIGPCFRVFDAAGTLLVEMDGGPVPGGVGVFVEFEPVPDDGSPPAGAPSRGRALVRVEVAPVPDDGQPVPEDGVPVGRLRRTVIPTVEVFDTATGKTVYTMPFK